MYKGLDDNFLECMMAFILVVSYRYNEVIRCKAREMFSFNKGFIATYFRTSSSVIINELVWALEIGRAHV